MAIFRWQKGGQGGLGIFTVARPSMGMDNKLQVIAIHTTTSSSRPISHLCSVILC